MELDNEYFRQLVEQASDAVLLLDADGAVVYANAATAELFGRHPGELLPRYGFVVTNLSRSSEQVVRFYNQRGKSEQYIKEGKQAINWTRLSCQKFRANEVRLQLHALAYNLANFMRTLALPRRVAHWSLTTLREKLVKSAMQTPESSSQRTKRPFRTAPKAVLVVTHWSLKTARGPA